MISQLRKKPLRLLVDAVPRMIIREKISEKMQQ